MMGHYCLCFCKAGFKADVKMQVLLAQPQLLFEAEQITERADMVLLLAGRH